MVVDGSRPQASPEGGFTLVELLAVLAILALLMGLSVLVFGGGQDQAYTADTMATIKEVETLISAYEAKHGDFPTCRLSELKLKITNDTNGGVEALLAQLHGKDHPTGNSLRESSLGNTDDDDSSTAFHRDGSSRLVEALDGWGNPIAYFHFRHYGRLDTYVMDDTVEEADLEQIAEAQQSEVTDVYANPQTYQLISAGPDGVFGSEDDVTNF